MSSSNNNKPQYIFPRIGIVNLQSIINTDLLLNQIQTYHGKYYQIFNLTNSTIFVNEKAKLNQSKFKWRGTPFSITQTIKILTKLQSYLTTKKGNTLIFCVNNTDSYLFVKLILKGFVNMCRWSIQKEKSDVKRNNNMRYSEITNQNIIDKLRQIEQSLTLQQPLFSQSLFQTYKKKQISSPPVKILCSFFINTPNFIPIYQIYQQSRYNDFQLIYTHQICNDLVTYYYNLQKPLQIQKRSIGRKYYDNKPQTKYLQKPITVCGDVKIICYSFNTLQKIKQFSIGFNTKQLIFSQQLAENQGIITFSYEDLFDKYVIDPLTNEKVIKNNRLYDQSIQVYVKLENWCQNQSCIYASNCEQCQQHNKKLNLRYNQTQSQLHKLYRQRTSTQVAQYFSFS